MDDTQQAMPAPISGPIPGEVRLAAGPAGPAGTARTAGTAGPIELNAGAPRTTLTVLNTGDRPVQVGSHYHLAEANPALDFDRDAAWGLRLDIPAGTAVRFEPGLAREVALVPIAGRRIVTGLRGISGARQEGRLDG